MKVFILLPFIKLIMIFGFVLFIIEKAIYVFIGVPILWFFTTIDPEEFVDNTSIVVYIAENYFAPFCESQGIYIERK